jgi:hypothetical protein
MLRHFTFIEMLQVIGAISARHMDRFSPKRIISGKVLQEYLTKAVSHLRFCIIASALLGRDHWQNNYFASLKKGKIGCLIRNLVF